MSEAPKKICKSYPHACPVCKGRGELTDEIAQHEGIVKYDLGDRKIYSCHVCQGQCLIWEHREEDAPEEHWPNQIAPIQLPPTILSPNSPIKQPFSQGPIGIMPYQPPDEWLKPNVTWSSNNPPEYSNQMDKPHNGKN